MAISKIPSAGFQDNVKFRNIIINGDMSIAQRGTSFTPGDIYTLDRFKVQNGNDGAVTVTQSTDVPTGQGFAKSLKIDVTTADTSIGSGQYMVLQQRIEGQNLQYLKKGTANAESTTLSFWVKSNATNTYTAEIRDADNTRYIGKTFTINDSNTWEKKTITFAGDTSGTLNNDNGRSLDLQIWLSAGSDYTGGTFNNGTWGAGGNNTRISSSNGNLMSSTSNELYITGVQLEAGEVASDFEFLPVDVNLQRCQRYYQQYDYTGTYHAISHGTVISGNQIRIIFPFINTMRSTPSLSNNGVGNFRLNAYGSGADQTCTGMSLIFGTVQNAELNFTKTTSNLSTNTNGRITTEHTNDASLIFNAEL